MDVPIHAPLKGNGNMDEINNANSETTGHPSSQAEQGSPTLRNHSSVRSTNPSFSDKLTHLVDKANEIEDEDEMRILSETDTESQESYFQHPESSNNNNINNNNAMFHRQHNFNNRDMELSLGNSDEEDEEEEDEDDDEERDNEENDQRNLELQLQRMELEHQGDYGDIQFFHHKLLLQQHLGHNEFGIGSSSSFGSANGLVNFRNNTSESGGGSVDSFHIEECDDNGISNSFSVS
jgi:hypothetical protein